VILPANGDLRIDGALIGNIIGSKSHHRCKWFSGRRYFLPTGRYYGKCFGLYQSKELLQLKNGSIVKGNISAAKLQVEPAATFNGQCHMQVSSGAQWLIPMNDLEETACEAASR
jgi:cytoskeletal protein CcmA (bactofilin family)